MPGRFNEYKLVFEASDKPVDTQLAKTKPYQDWLTQALEAVDSEWRAGLVTGVGFTSFEEGSRHHHAISIQIKTREAAEKIASYFPDHDLIDEKGNKVVGHSSVQDALSTDATIDKVLNAIRNSTGDELAAAAVRGAARREEILSSSDETAPKRWAAREEKNDTPPKRER